MTQTSTQPSSDWFSFVVKLLYNQNPFYLIGTFLILFGLQQSLGSRPDLGGSGLLVLLLVGYTLLISAAAAVVIRYGQVWDDARTILLVIVLMFFTLSASLDVHLIEAPLAGTLLLAAGLAFSIGLSESLLRGLRIRLAACYRGPYYLLLAILFLYPVALAWLNELRLEGPRSWMLFAFPIAAAAGLLTLLPAARTPAFAEPASGTPWKWPFYPWSLFVYLTVGFAIRAWSLTIAFEPAAGSAASFRPYFLVPLVVAWAALVLEMGRVRHNSCAVAAGLLLPVAGLVLGFIGPAGNPIAAGFEQRLALTLGSPAQLAVWTLVAYYAWAWSREVPAAEGFLVAAALLASVTGPRTVDWTTLASPQPLLLAVVGSGFLYVAVRRQSTWRVALAAVMAGAGAGYAAPDLANEAAIGFWRWHGPLVALVAVAAIFNDDLAKGLRELAWRAVPVLAALAAVVYPWTMPAVGPLTLTAYLAMLLLASIGLWQRTRTAGTLGASLTTLAANGVVHFHALYRLLGETALADGRPWLAAGLVLVALALLISLLKMGLWQEAWQWLERLNVTLVGTKSQPASHRA